MLRLIFLLIAIVIFLQPQLLADEKVAGSGYCQLTGIALDA